jgi:carboxyl-terminal processing protease
MNESEMEKVVSVRKEKNRSLLIGLLIGLVTGIALSVLGWSFYTLASPQEADFSYTTDTGEIKWSAVEEKLSKIKKMIDTYYKDEVVEEDLVEGLYAGYVSGLGDPYSTYYTKEEYDQMVESSEGTYFGVGMYLQENEDTGAILVIKPIPDSPAEEAGILAGDVIMEVDGEDISKDDVTIVATKIRGPEGTQVEVTIWREGESGPLTFSLERREIETPTVDYEMKEGNIGYISIMEFDDITVPQFEQAVNALLEEGMESVVLDLRDNPGGNLDTVVEIADMLLPEGLVVYTEDKYGIKKEFETDAAQVFQLPMVVLVNGNSASAAEILAGSIKDYEAGTLLGTTTFGKGIVQQVIPLGDGTGVKVTISKYFTPKGNDIHGVGIKPDVEMEFDVEAYKENKEDNQLEAAIDLMKDAMGE